MALTMEDMHWYTVGRYHLDGTVPMDAVIDELEPVGNVIDVDEEGGYVVLSLDKTFLSTAKNMGELKGDARYALPRPQGCDRPVEVINVTRSSDMQVFGF
ncbi:hypothetical protein H7J87_00070 [Mycolicibacterium wolinskyi]|uniref:Uncharacterized protein n=1 Tax=Mycolicibacterium wolinskyi TaxID=59750 RepID=A0A1X2F4X0_9MYCO|nr:MULTISPECIES: hypothetical protein [Mycolicibacterium]MCV7283730.1 hypothetical protein [Mycolicibacterium wolinskyi]MCV7292985.1 hypothetical protein [Mycolicibacterium goodii]ORX13490.1 hypothetical protein AWC31_30045 [Mycolicibacterium wolinskyi]